MQYVKVTEFWKIYLIGMREKIRIANFTMVLLTVQNTFQIFFKVFLVRNSKHLSSIETIKELS